MGFASISTDFYLPALSVVAASLRSDAGTVEFTISGYLVGFSLGQLLWGPIGDRYGRRMPVAIGLVLFAIGSAGCALSGSAHAMIDWRLVQAVGAGVVLGRAMVRDLYAGNRAAQMPSTLMTVMAIAPLDARRRRPAHARRIVHAARDAPARSPAHRAADAGVCGLRPPAARGQAAPLHGKRRLLLRRHLCLYRRVALRLHHLSPLAGPALRPAVRRRHPRPDGDQPDQLAAGDALRHRADAHYRQQCGGLAGLAVPLFLFVSATGFIVANAVAGALAAYPQRAGAFSALVGAIQYGAGIVGSALVGLFDDGTPRPMAVVIAIAGVGGLLCTGLLRASSVTAPAPRSA